MHRLYMVLKQREHNQITTDEIAVASGKRSLDLGALSAFLQNLESANATLERAFEKQANAAAVSPLSNFHKPLC
jgi:hypothetical protein